MSTAGEVHHPAVYRSLIAPEYILLGVVKDFKTRVGFNDIEITDPEYMMVNWQNVDANGTRFHDAMDKKVRYNDEEKFYNVSVTFDYINGRHLKRVGKCGSNDIRMINKCIQAVVWDNFYHMSKSGWNKLLPRSAD